MDLIPYGQSTRHLGSSPAASEELSRVKSSDSTRSGDGTAGRSRSIGHGRDEQKTIPDAGAGTFKGPIKERRHQIPGLRQTAYLKVYLLRCDDGETYKANSRKALREWIKEHAQPSSSHASQESHDAFEWLVVHVVLPNTPAATQPRSSGSSGPHAGNASERPSSASRWPGRGSSTVLEKIRSDFNSSSKSSIDRVAQVRLHKTDIPPHLLPDSLASGPTSDYDSPSEGQQEQEAAWSDLVAKFKALILTSFDLRVRQYEADIREKDAQRKLPGWNFCTFFVLKEGLARGFESVGLVEDALIGYDELAVGLDSIVRDQASEDQGGGHGGEFLKYTEDLRRQAESARAQARPGSSISDARGEAASDRDGDDLDDQGGASLPLSATKKRYRDLVLSNNISIFDFRCYVFARQVSLLLRLGNAWSSRAELMAKLRTYPTSEQAEYLTREPSTSAGRTRPTSAEEPEDLMVLAEVCARGADFITSVARVMRSDLHSAYRFSAAHADTTVDESSRKERSTASASDKEGEMSQIIDNMVSSWTYSVSQQILAETSTKALPIPPSSLAETNPSSTKVAAHGGKGQEPKSAIPEPKTMMHPARVSSLSLNPNQHVQPGQPSPNVFSSGMPPSRDRSRPNESNARRNAFLKAGIEDLAANRAELYLLSRSVLDDIGRQRRWLHGSSLLSQVPTSTETELEEVDLNGSEKDSRSGRTVEEAVSPADTRGLSNKLLQTAIRDKQDFYNLYEVCQCRVEYHLGHGADEVI